MVVNAVGAVVFVLLGVFSVRRTIFLVAALLPRRPLPELAGLPAVTLLVPARDEAATIASLFNALDRLDYPRECLQIVLINDASRDSTGAELARFAASRPHAVAVDLIVPAGKGAALNHGLAVAAPSDVVVICDADLRPRPDYLRRLVAAFADSAVGAAAPFIAPRNSRKGAIARYAAVESWVHQLVTSAAKDRLALDAPTLGGSAYRRAALDEIGGFPTHVSGEDVRASAALTRAGWSTRFVAGSVAENSVVERWPDYWHQHARWGRDLFAIAPGKRARMRLGPSRRFEAWMHAAGYADRLAFASALPLVAVGALQLWVPAAFLAIAGAEVLVAIGKAGSGRNAASFVACTAAVFPLDVLATVAFTVSHLARRPATWRSPIRAEPSFERFGETSR